MLDIIRRKWPKSLGIVPDRANQEHQEEQFIQLFHWKLFVTERHSIRFFQLSYDQEGHPISRVVTPDDGDVGMTGIKQLCKSSCTRSI